MEPEGVGSLVLSEEVEKERRETRRKEWEAEMAGDLEKQWKEMAEERKLRTEVSTYTGDRGLRGH